MASSGFSVSVSRVRRSASTSRSSVTVVACDVAERKQVKRLFEADRRGASAAAVVHAAGVLDDGLLDGLTQERCRGCLAQGRGGVASARVDGEDTRLRAFVLFSSMAGNLGGAGQSAYAAANAWLDALASYRRARGCFCDVAASGPWAQVGMADN